MRSIHGQVLNSIISSVKVFCMGVICKYHHSIIVIIELLLSNWSEKKTIITMNQGPVSCLPMNSKMSKVKKALDEARETRARELDLVDKNVISFDEMPGLCKFM